MEGRVQHPPLPAPMAQREIAGGRRVDGARSDALLTAAAWALPTAFILVPLLLFLTLGFFEVQGTDIAYHPTLKNYARFFTDAGFLPTFISTCWLGLKVAAIAVIFGYPIAYLLASLRGRAKYTVAMFFAVPLLMSYIIKIYAIRSILGGNGFLNRTLLYLGIIDEPWTFLIFNLNAVMLTLAILLIPFAILPIFVALERIPRNLLEASADLGARPLLTFLTVILPLSLQGVVIGASLTFVLAIGDYVTPQMVGGIEGFTFGRIIYSQFGFGNNWPFGAALSVILLIPVLMAIVAADRAGRARYTT
jgi:spermidine/putrescine transport system permease protein